MTDITLSERERADLLALVSLEGFKAIQKIFQSECSKFQLALINADPANHDAVLAAHQMAKASAQFYAGVVNRINQEIELYSSRPTPEAQPDRTEELFQ